MKTLLLWGLLSFFATAAGISTNGIVPGGGDWRKPVTSLKEQKFIGMVRQQTDFSCGAAALATILKYSYHINTNEQWVMDGMLAMSDPTMVARYGFSMLDMKGYVEMIGMEARGYSVESDALYHLVVPVIVLLNINGFHHFVVLKKVDEDGRVYISDPALGNKTIDMDEFEPAWNNIILAVVGRGYDKNSILSNPRGPLTARGKTNRFVPVSDAALMEFGFSHKDLL